MRIRRTVAARTTRSTHRRVRGRLGQDGGVRKPSRRTVEVESLEKLDALLAGGATSMSGWHLQDLDLRGREDALTRLDARGALLLGCTLDPTAAETLRARGALLFPSV